MVKATDKKYIDIIVSFDNAGILIWQILWKGRPYMPTDEGLQFIVDSLSEVEEDIKKKLYEKDKH